ncbi:hypothetical protein [Plantactinospora sp. KBS50]|uniref:hypothetical protein n=1 Tax=Plantactinospora sp. KBS50 TaxID=2024580 RepID=UPI0012FD161F|nr:hypothetical protein [Plantactinospora sp. KBS50]
MEAGTGNLAELPRALREQPGYDRPVTMTCPSNVTGDLYREVTYLVKQRYVEMSATVRAYFPASDDRDSRVRVTVYVALPQRDGTFVVNRRGQPFDALMSDPKPMTSDVSGAEKVTIRVQCEAPHGWVVLSDGLLTGD